MFNWKSFLVKLAVLAEPIVVGSLQLKNETGKVSNTQLAADSLNLATGVSDALLSDDPNDKALGDAASQVTAQIIAGIAATHPSLNPPKTP
jgi:hypothetical protein